MERQTFIIPKFKLIAFMLVLICWQSKTLYAQVYGCRVVVGISDRLYYTPYGAGSPTEWQTIVSGTVTSTGETGGFRSNGTAAFGCMMDIGGSCTVYQQYEISAGPPQIIGMRVYRTGVYASLDPINCTIDGYIPFFFIFTLMVAILEIKKIGPINE
jgi:hypothetical protein